MTKRFDDYAMKLAEDSAAMSYCKRLKVGAVAMRGNRPLCTGWNGTPAGTDNCCEEPEGFMQYEYHYKPTFFVTDYRTKPDVSHAERNLIEYAASEGIALRGSTMYVTHAPCIECAKSIKNAGIVEVVWKSEYKSTDGLDYLTKYGVTHRKV